MLMWGAEFFSLGYSTEYIEHLNYWDYLELTKGFSLRNKSEKHGGSSYFAEGKELSDTHKQMIKNRDDK